jgi:glyoxylase-like metal-dependent hydrolase (beta-lactamase superfamily II)
MTTTIGRRAALGMGLAAPLAAALPSSRPASAQGASPAPQGAGFYRFRLGDARCAVVSDGALEAPLPVQAVLAANASPEAVAATLAERFLPADRATLHFNALFVDTGRDKVLIDAGSAASMGPAAGKLAQNLRAAGVDPAEVGALVISHAHPDHLFGALGPDGSPVFPNARVLIGEAEHAFWTAAADLSRSAAAPEMKQAMTEGARKHLAALKDRLELVQPERELVPGLTALATPGHTPGHLSFVLDSGGRQLFLTKDVVHHFGLALPHPEWKVSFDADPDQAVETRKRVLDRIAADRALVLAYHFPFPGLGHVGRGREAAYGWEPVVWSWDPEGPIG